MYNLEKSVEVGNIKHRDCKYETGIEILLEIQMQLEEFNNTLMQHQVSLRPSSFLSRAQRSF